MTSNRDQCIHDLIVHSYSVLINTVVDYDTNDTKKIVEKKRNDNKHKSNRSEKIVKCDILNSLVEMIKED